MLLNANFLSQFNYPTYSDYPVELSYAASNSSTTPNQSPSPPSLFKLSLDSPREPAVSQSKERRTFDLPCAICSSTATGYHYNVASCNGCKTFFRRCVLSKIHFQCIRSDSNCLSQMRLVKGVGARIKCRSCRLDRCLQQGMRREAVTSSILPSESRREAPDVYVEYLSQPSTSTDLARVTETAATLRQTLRLINKFRRSNVHLQDIDLHISTLLSMPSFLEIQGSYEEVRDFSQFKRDLPAWLTVDLLCAIEFVKKIPDLAKFKDSDKEELIRSTCFTLAIAIQAIESYFDQHTRVVMPDGTDVIQAIISTGGVIHSDYNQMFVTVLDPLHREKFTIDELVLALQLLFFTIADSKNLSPEGKDQRDKSVQCCMQSLMVFLITKNKENFSSRYGALTALNETFIKVSYIHKQKMKEAEPFRQKLQDLLIEQCVYDYRPF